MSRLDEQLRAAARSARTAADGGLELERDLAATKVRAMSMPPAPAPDGRSHRWLLAVAAVLLIAMFAGGLMLLRGSDDEQIATVGVPDTSDVPVTTTVETTMAPQPTPSVPAQDTGTTIATVATTTVATDVPTSVGGAVSYVEPPPTLAMRPLGTVELADATKLGGVAIGDLGVVVNHYPGAGFVTVLGFDGTARDVPIDEALGALAYGPGDVVYGIRADADGALPSQPELVAVALDGPRQGDGVASVSPSLPGGWQHHGSGLFGHGIDGIVDRLDGANTTLMSYVDIYGEPLVWNGAAPQQLTVSYSEVITVTTADGPTWSLAVDPMPELSNPFGTPLPPMPSSVGTAIYLTPLGYVQGSDPYFDEPAMWAIAALHPDGHAEWWSVPEGWWIQASDVWGTVLARWDGNQLELALADFAGEALPVADCSGALSPEATAELFADAMIAARATGDFSLVADCLDAVPDVFTGMPPYCWEACGDMNQTFGSAPYSLGEADASDSSWWFVMLPVSYTDGDRYIDLWESWELRPVDGRYVVSGVTIEEPPMERTASLAVIVEYLGHIERGDWSAAAAMLDDGALSPEERPDLRRLAPDDYTTEGVAAALARWCSTGCDTTPPTADELVFDGSYRVVRGGEEIRAGWYEGHYSVSGLPFRT